MTQEVSAVPLCLCTVQRPVSVVSYQRIRHGKLETVQTHCRSRKWQHASLVEQARPPRLRWRAAARRIRTRRGE